MPPPVASACTHLRSFRRKLFARAFLPRGVQHQPSSVLSRAMTTEYKIKGLSSLSLKDGEKREAEVEGIEGGKVLLVKTGGKTHALSSKCTHYGAPLKNAVLTPNGRLTCPWHGACFDVASGDVEDAPALDGLARYEIVEKLDGVYIKGDEATIKANRRKANFKCSATGEGSIIVVGGGSGSIGALQGLRENGCVAPITLISREPNLPIDRIKLSKALITDASKILLRPQEWYDEAGITTITDNVTSVDFENKSVSTESGKSYRYTKLILATGGTPKRLPLPGFKELSNIFVLRSVTDVKEIVAAVGDKGKKVVIVGSSFIGMEIANALAKENTVSVIGMETVPLERVLGSKIGASVQKMCEKTGVKFYLEAGVEKATPSTTSPNAVGAVHLKDGTAIEADLVILGVGISPATEYLQSSKAVTLEKDGSLKTNAAFEVVGLESVYAVGDIATYPYHGPGGNGAPTRIEHWNVAQNAGRRAGGSIARPAAPPKPFIPIFWSALGSQLRYCGNTVHGWDGLVVQGHLAEGRFAAFYAKGETIVAVATMGMDPVMAKAADLMLVGKMPGKAELEKGADLLAVAF